MRSAWPRPSAKHRPQPGKPGKRPRPRAGIRSVRRKARKAIRHHQLLVARKDAQIAAATAELRKQIRAIETEIEGRYADRQAAVAVAIDARNAELAAIAARVRERWEETEFDLPERPEPEVDVDDSGLLYDSRRHWLDQLKAFRAAKAGADDETDAA